MVVMLGDPLTFGDVVAVTRGETVEIARDVPERMRAARSVVEAAVESGRAVYGISTGLGDLANVRIDPHEARRVQHDIVRSHATAVGPPLPEEVVRAMLLLKARTFASGVSGVRFDLVERIVTFLNNGVHPIVPAQGSLGASGDLAPLAHLALPLFGEGEATVAGRPLSGADALSLVGFEPLDASYKEGLALVNGTELMLALGILTFERARTLARAADVASAMSVEAALGTDRAFAPDIIELRKHPGASLVAANLRRVLAKSEIVASHRDSEHLVQDAYSLRCIPQVHGAYRDALRYVEATLEAELGSAIDNPSVLAGGGEVVSGGNFHGEALGLALDHLSLCLTGYSTIAERRVARLVDPDLNNGLSAFLTPDPGRRSGFMIAQYTAASLVSESRSLCWPASADSIPTSAGQEDHVSMGATSARKAAQIADNTARVIAIELLTAAQGLDLRAPLRPAPGTSTAHAAIRRASPQVIDDRPLAPDIETVTALIETGEVLAEVEREVGTLD